MNQIRLSELYLSEIIRQHEFIVLKILNTHLELRIILRSQCFKNFDVRNKIDPRLKVIKGNKFSCLTLMLSVWNN